MKKINLFLTLLYTLISLGTPNTLNKVIADVGTYELIAPVVDFEPNDTMDKAIQIEENSTNIYSPLYKTQYVAGILPSSSDVDFYSFNVYGDSTVGLQLTMLDSSMIYALNYDFTIYKQKNGTFPCLINSELEEIYTSNNSGTNENYSFIAEAGTYYIKVFAHSSSSSRYSYKLMYSVRPNNNSTFNLQNYANSNDNGIVVWEAD